MESLLLSKRFRSCPILKSSPTTIYCHYVDDCLIVIDNIDSLIALKQTFEVNSLLQFTHEIGTRDNINFLDIQVSVHEDSYQTAVSQKPTNSAIYFHYDTECPQRYKDGTISVLIHRTYKISSNWAFFSSTIIILKQTFNNNGYPNWLFESILQNYLNKKYSNTYNINELNIHNIYYQNKYSNAYKTDEGIITQIIKNNTECTNKLDQLKIIIYYKSHTIANLISKNNQSCKPNNLKQTNMIYKYACNIGDCDLQNSTYIGMTTTTLSRRITMHLAAGGAKIRMHNKQMTQPAEKTQSKTQAFYSTSMTSTDYKSWRQYSSKNSYPQSTT